MLKHLMILAGILAMQACAMGDGGSTTDLAVENGVAPTAALPSGQRVGFVLAHGLAGSVDSYDPAIVSALQADGYYVLRDAVPPVDSVAVRAAALATQVDTFIAANKLDRVHLIGHSMGGLDGRYLISSLHYASKITSLTTLETPHRGSPLADIALGITRSITASQADALLALTDVLGSDVDSAQVRRALSDLAEAHAPAFNAANPDAPGVTYYSYAGYSTLFGVTNWNADGLCATTGVATPRPSSLPGELQLTGPIVGGFWLRPHDGVVPVESAMWTGFQGCLPTDHLDMTRAGAKDAAELDFALVPFYRQIAARVGSL